MYTVRSPQGEFHLLFLGHAGEEVERSGSEVDKLVHICEIILNYSLILQIPTHSVIQKIFTTFTIVFQPKYTGFNFYCFQFSPPYVFHQFIGEFQKMQGKDHHSKCIDTVNKLQESINSFHQQLIGIIKKEEEDRLEDFKDELISKKLQFEKINLLRSENVIKQNIMAKKMALEKECAASLQKSMEASKMYQKLKQKLTSMEAQQRQMQLESKYLEKRIVIAEKRKILLQRTKKQMIESEQNQKELFKRPINQRDSAPILAEITNNFFPEIKQKQIVQVEKNRQVESKWLKKMKLRIQCTKEYLQSMTFIKSDLQKIFQPYIRNKSVHRMNGKQKFYLGEHILNQPDVKRQLYKLMFED